MFTTSTVEPNPSEIDRFLMTLIEPPIFKVELIHPNAKLPTRANKRDAGWDVYYPGESVELLPQTQFLFRTGLKIECPNGLYLRARPRSGNALKFELDVKAGTIDEPYRGELGIILRNESTTKPYLVEKGHRIAQLEIRKTYEDAEFVLADRDLSSTSRGAGGFGSTGN